MVCNLGDLDAFAQTHLLDRFDATNLTHWKFFATWFRHGNLTIEIYRIFAAFPGAASPREYPGDSNNSFAYLGQLTLRKVESTWAHP